MESCLTSVFRALEYLSGEVIVIDNHSVDGSVSMIRQLFPDVKLVENDTNAGFSKANNQGMRLAGGRYVLFLNPDTLIEESTLIRVVEFMDQHPHAGAVGVKMIDGKGKFLPESKRSVPVPAVAFFKVFGFARLFPRSGVFNRYALGNLDPDKTHNVEILSGAFMMVRKEVLDKTGGFDEDYFMYGEDIDLSYRILKLGYKNYYFAGTTIIHYKGESTKKGSLNYVLMFYKAMLLFAEKHFSASRSNLLGFVIKPAVYFRAVISVVRRILVRILYPLLDILFFYCGYLFLVPLWEKYRFDGLYSYPDVFRYLIIPLYILFWISGIGLAGGYVRPVRPGNVVKGILSSTALILILYALIPLELRFSRALILLGAAWALISAMAYRRVLSWMPVPEFRMRKRRKKRILIAGDRKEYERISGMMKEMPLELNIVGYVGEKKDSLPPEMLGSLDETGEVIRIHDVDEVIFSADSVPQEKMIEIMASLASSPVTFRVALPESSFIVGSDSGNLPGELYLIGMNSIALSENKTRKRFLDLGIAVLFLILFPVMILFVNKPRGLFRNILAVLSGKISWVGFCSADTENNNELAGNLKPGVLCPASVPLQKDALRKLNLAYAKDYHLWKDIRIIFTQIRKLGG